MLLADKSCKQCIMGHGTISVHTVLPDGEEMYEEYDMMTKLVRGK